MGQAKNAEIVNVLRRQGYNIPDGFDTSGTQRSEFFSRLLAQIDPAGNQNFVTAFDKAREIAGKLADIPDDASPHDRLFGTIQAWGVSKAQIGLIAKATDIRSKAAGRGLKFNDQDYGAAVAEVLGENSPIFGQVMGHAGWAQMPSQAGVDSVPVWAPTYGDPKKPLGSGELIAPAQPTAPGGAVPAGTVPQQVQKAAPAPAPAAPPAAAPAAAPPTSGVTMGTTKSRATPGVAAPQTTPGVPAPASTGAPDGAGAAGGGGASNQPPPPATWNDDQIRTFIKQNFGANAYFVDIPEVWDALKNVVKSGKGVNGLEPALEQTAFWKQNTSSARSWYVKEKADPAQAAADVAQQTQAINGLAQQAGITIDPERAREIAQSYLRYGWTQTDLQRALGAEWHYDPSSKNQAAAITKMKTDAQNWLVPLSDQAIQTWGQGIISGTTTDAQFQQYLRDNAKSLMPQLSNLIDAHAGDPNFNVSTFADPYKQHAANALGISTDQIDLTDPKWRKALDQIDPKTGERRIMSLSEWDSTLKSDPTYGYDKTTNGINDGLTLANQLKASMGLGG